MKNDYPFAPRARIQPGGEEHLRQPVPVTAPGEMEQTKMFALAILHLKNVLDKLPVMIEDHSKPVDEYQPQTLLAESEMTITLQPQWETPEIIRSVIITGPANSAVTVQLGDRTWNLIINTTGYLSITNIAIIMSRMDNRILTAGSPGNYTFELMGHADTRGNLV